MNSAVHTHTKSVKSWENEVVIPSYLPCPPDKNPMFIEKRVYQGSSGKIYPLPFTDRISEVKTDRLWRAVWLENEYLQVLILPEIGGRIHAILDKTNNYDLVYRQHVIKPALVGLAGPWISGGIEFNWPQHHRPATFLPVDVEIERHEDGSCTVWCSSHDPLTRMKGMHGVCLHPDRSVVELKVRVYNRTPLIQTFLWWANVCTEVHAAYQSFFPPDVTTVADHAKRGTSSYPLCDGIYYGIDYGSRAGQLSEHILSTDKGSNQLSEESQILRYAANDLSWYANIPVPTSYMCMNSRGNFFGGYDHAREAGIVHVADHYISPGKKQWTWGNHSFGYSWDQNLSDDGRPYIELMAGVYTDNQPDFSFLKPGETKTWSQYWYPIQKIGPVHAANTDAAVRVDVSSEKIKIGLCVTSAQRTATIVVKDGIHQHRWAEDLTPGSPFIVEYDRPNFDEVNHVLVTVFDANQVELIAFSPQDVVLADGTESATEPPAPEDVHSTDELYLIGLHLEQYRHATRSPIPYWHQALKLDPQDWRCNNAIGLWHLRRGEYDEANLCFRTAIGRLTRRNPNPRDGEAYYNLGVCLRFQRDCHEDSSLRHQLMDEARSAFAKAAWNMDWAASSYHALAEIACIGSDWSEALRYTDLSLNLNQDNLLVRNLRVLVLLKLGRAEEASIWINQTLAIDRLDWWARDLSGLPASCDVQTAIDVAHDYARSGFYDAAIKLLDQSLDRAASEAGDLPTLSLGAVPMLLYTKAWFLELSGNAAAARGVYFRASEQSPDYCFPARLEEISILKAAMRVNDGDVRAPAYLGCLMYDRQRYAEAIELWEYSNTRGGGDSVTWRNLGIAYFNFANNHTLARNAYDRAFEAAPREARLLFERDQLWSRTAVSHDERLLELRKHKDLVRMRDDLTVAYCSLLIETGYPQEALDELCIRQFQPWEGGEGQALSQYCRARTELGKRALRDGDCESAIMHFHAALNPPKTLGESKHLLANQSDLHYWLGKAYAAIGDEASAGREWYSSATFTGDFQDMSVRRYSEMTYYSALSWRLLGDFEMAEKLLNGLHSFGRELEHSTAKIDYFATSLPTMLLFNDDLQERQIARGKALQRLAEQALRDEYVSVKYDTN